MPRFNEAAGVDPADAHNAQADGASAAELQ